ncbi:nonstructural protein [La Gloria virus]|uniref:Nonstructural protein n=1 Tax=La Gloria virus TaxID=2559110 RepID=A0A482KAQ3_9VIRU|nr:nonstructural protein [La Gloria virus]QBQ01750.1 nonstructural protein [La Gloria virus]
MTNRYCYDMPVTSWSANPLKRISIHYMAYNKPCTFQVSRFDTLEFPLEKFTQSTKTRATLNDFIKKKELPVQWGGVSSQVFKPSPRVFLGLIMGLSDCSSEDYVKYDIPLLKKAISWPLTYPSHAFINLIAKKDSLGPWVYKSMAATYMLRATNSICLEEAIVKMNNLIKSKAREMGLDMEVFSGENLLLEIAHIQCLLLISASRSTMLIKSQIPKVFRIILDYDKLMSEYSKEIATFSEDVSGLSDMIEIDSGCYC